MLIHDYFDLHTVDIFCHFHAKLCETQLVELSLEVAHEPLVDIDTIWQSLRVVVELKQLFRELMP